MGDYVAARMAAEDFGGKVLGAPIEVIQADLQNKRRCRPVDRAQLVRRARRSMRSSAWAIQRSRWRCRNCARQRRQDRRGDRRRHHRPDRQGVLAVRRALDLRQLFRRQGAGDHAGGAGQEEVVLRHSDYAFGHSLEDNASEILKGLGGEVVGHGAGAAGRDRLLVASGARAASSGADAVGIAAGGADFINIAKQMGEFGLIRRGIVPAALNCSLTNIHSLGLPTAQGMVFSQPYYWDHDEPITRFRRALRQAVPQAPADGVPGEHLGRGDALPEIDRGGRHR